MERHKVEFMCLNYSLACIFLFAFFINFFFLLNNFVYWKISAVILLPDEEFVILLKKGVVISHTHNVWGFNYCVMNVFPFRIPVRVIIVSIVSSQYFNFSHACISNLDNMTSYNNGGRAAEGHCPLAFFFLLLFLILIE